MEYIQLSSKIQQILSKQRVLKTLLTIVLRMPSVFYYIFRKENPTLIITFSGTPTWNTPDPSFLYPVNEYLWLNDLYPTFSVHNATTALIAKPPDL